MHAVVLSVVQARVGDCNDLAIPGTKAVGDMLAKKFALQPVVLGKPQPALGRGWKEELEAALPDLKQIAAHIDQSLADGARLLTASHRCAASHIGVGTNVADELCAAIAGRAV